MDYSILRSLDYVSLRLFYTANSFQFARTIRLSLAHQSAPKNAEIFNGFVIDNADSLRFSQNLNSATSAFSAVKVFAVDS